jgi:carbamoyltransferase
MLVLGIHPIGHDTSVSLIKDGKIIFAIEEERLSKEKHSKDFPHLALKYTLKKNNLNINDISTIALSGDYDEHIKKRYFLYWSKIYPKNKSRVLYELENIKKISSLHDILRIQYSFKNKIFNCRHHLAHFASSYFTSSFKESALFSIDGVGDYESALSGYANKNNFEVFDETAISYPHSIGLVYTAITAWLGFIPHYDEGKTMGLSSYGNKNKFYKIFDKIILIKNKGQFEINLDFFDYPFIPRSGVSRKFKEIFGEERKKNEKIKQIHMDVAASLQQKTEEVFFNSLKYLYNKTKCKNLSLAGGVALNCVANGKIFKNTNFKNIRVQPAAGDNGTSLGAALYWYYAVYNKRKTHIGNNPRTSYFGTSFSDTDCLKFLKKNKIKFSSPKNIFFEVSKLLSSQKIIAWFNGKMEFGPRALGNRSLITSPFPKKMKDILNLRVKKRESFRPFAPVVMEEFQSDFFKSYDVSPNMLFAWDVIEKKKKLVPAITHIDGTARVQTVSLNDNPKLYNLIKAFKALTGVPIILNTSFNIMGQPICHDLEDAFKTFKINDIDYLVLNSKFIIKK